MNKKGFTLVELLAVIAILAILVIIAMPNVLDMFNKAKEDAFMTEAQSLFKSVQQDFVVQGGKAATYANGTNCTSDNARQAKMDGKELTYYITVNSQGEVTEFEIADGTYYYGNTKDGLKIEDIEIPANNDVSNACTKSDTGCFMEADVSTVTGCTLPN